MILKSNTYEMQKIFKKNNDSFLSFFENYHY